MKKAMKCMAGILALTLAFAQVAPVSAFAEETTATTATEEAQAVYSGDCSAEGSSVTWTYNPTEKTCTQVLIRKDCFPNSVREFFLQRPLTVHE